MSNRFAGALLRSPRRPFDGGWLELWGMAHWLKAFLTISGGGRVAFR
jgi:hypothetical protein